MHYVYILQSQKNGRLYKGLTNNLRRRLQEHNAGRAIFTRNLRPWKVVYYEAFTEKADATREEKFLKSGKGREQLKFLLKSTLESLKK